MAEDTVGSIVGYLRLDASNWTAELERAGRKADDLARHDPRINIKTNAAETIAKLQAVAAAVNKLESAQATLAERNKAATDAQKDLAAAQEKAANVAVSATDRQVKAAQKLADARQKAADAAQATIGTEKARANAQVRAAAAVERAEQGVANATKTAEADRAKAVIAANTEVRQARAASTSASNALAKASRDAEVAELGLAAAYQKTSASADKAAESTERVAKSTENLSRSADKAHGGVGALVKAALLLGPAIVPLGAVAAASFGALGAAGGVALATVKGISAEMAAGTKLGKQYTAAFGTLKSNVAALEHTGAVAAFPGVTKGLGTINSLMPQLNDDTRVYGGLLGQAADHVIHGLAKGFVALDPLFAVLLKDAVALTAKFDTFASGNGLTKFGDYVQQNLPAIGHDIAEVAELIEHLLEAGAGQGVSVLNALGLVASAINAIPVGTLQHLIPVITDAYLAFKVFGGAAKIIGTVTTALELLTGAEIAAKAAGGGTIDVPTVSTKGKIVGAAKDVANDLIGGATTAGGIRGIAGRIGGTRTGGTVAQFTEKQLAGGGLLIPAAEESAGGGAAAAGLGYGAASGIGSSAIGLAAPVAAAGLLGYAAYKYGGNQYKPNNVQAGSLAARYNNGGKNAVNDQTTASYNPDSITGYGKGVGHATPGADAAIAKEAADSAAKLKAAQDARFAAAKRAAAATAAEAAALKQTPTLYAQTTAAAAADAAQLKLNTAVMQTESDAAGLLSGSLGKLGTSGADVASSQTSLGSANLALAASFKSNGSAISASTAKGIANRQALESQHGAALSLAEAIGKQTGSTVAEVASLNASKAAAIAKAKAAGTLTKGMLDYINTLYKIPPQKLTKIDADTAAAETKVVHVTELINGIPSVHDVYVNALGDALFTVGEIKTQLEGIKDKNITITAKEIDSVNPNAFTPGYGQGTTKSKKASAVGGGLPDGWSTVGEQGWEAVYKQGNSVQVLSNPQSKRLMGQERVPGYASGTLTGNAASIASALRGLGLSNVGIAGVLGNLKIESNFNPSAYNARENAHGIAQWEGGRANDDTRSNSLSRQIKNLLRELRGGYSSALAAVKKAKTPSGAASAFDRLFERSSGAARGARESAAEDIYKKMAGKDGSTVVNGITYASATSAKNAQVRAAKSAAAAKADAQASAKSTGASSANSYFDGLASSSGASLGLAHQVANSGGDFGTALANVAAYQKGLGGKGRVSQAARAIAKLRTENTYLQMEIKDRTQLAAKLATANDNLANAKANRSNEYTGVKAGIIGSASLSSSGYADTFSIKTYFANKVAQAQQFYKDEKLALAHGVDPALVQELIEAGPDAGAVSLHTLATASKSDVKSINKLQNTLNKTAAATASYSAHKFYDSGVSVAQGIVNGLTAQQKTVNGAIKKLADAMVAQFRKELGIKSPSTVFRAHGRHIGSGLVAGITDSLPHVKVAATKLSGAALPTSTATGTGGPSAFTLDAVHLTGDVRITEDGRLDPSDLLVSASISLNNGRSR